MNNARKIETNPWLEIVEKYRLPGETNRQFGKRLGLNHGIIGQWERGDQPSVKTLNNIKNKIGITEEDFSKIMLITHDILTAGSDAMKRKITDALLSGKGLPQEHWCAQILAKKPDRQNIRAFLKELGFSLDRWMELINKKDPSFTQTELKNILRHPAIAEDIDVFLKILGLHE